jgi:hypothetical protein
MPAPLTDTHLADPYVPLSWRGVLEDLRAFTELEKKLREGNTSVEAAELARLHDRVVERSAELLEPAALDDLRCGDINRLLLRSALTLVRLKQAVVADQSVLDTAGSRTLALFESDYFGSPETVAAFVNRARKALNLTEEDVRAEEAALAGDLVDATRKQAIVRALRDAFNLWPDAAGLRAGIAGLFQAIYPHAPLPPDEVELVVTSTLVFFCLPLDKSGEALTTERFAQSSPGEKNAVKQFLSKQKRFTQQRFASFPAFGLVECDRLDPDLLQRIAAKAQVDVAELIEELPRLVTILPQAEIDKYLIHDVWGHGWQASMLRFDDLYEQIADFAEPLDLSEASPNARLAECFVGTGDALKLDEERFREFATSEVCQRLPIALSAVLAEMLADVAEYKFLADHPERADWLPSSSRLSAYPAMLDLTLADIPFYFGQATKTFRLWTTQEPRQTQLIEQLVTAGSGHPAACFAVSHAIDVWRQLEQDYFRAELDWSEVDGRLRVNAYTRVALNFVGLHRALLTTYRELSAQPVGNLPLKSFRDLLVLAASVFFEADPARHLWRVDEFLTLAFVPFCRRLVAAEDAT